MLKRHLSVLVLLLLFRLVVVAQQQQLPKWSARVMVDVGADEKIKNAVISYISRELRALGDITITDNNPDYVLDILTVPNESTDGSIVWGYTFSIIVLKVVDLNVVDMLAHDKLSEVSIKTLHNYYGNTFRFLDHLLKTGATDAVDNVCKRTITDIDARHFEPERKSRQSLIELTAPKKN